MSILISDINHRIILVYDCFKQPFLFSFQIHVSLYLMLPHGEENIWELLLDNIEPDACRLVSGRPS